MLRSAKVSALLATALLAPVGAALIAAGACNSSGIRPPPPPPPPPTVSEFVVDGNTIALWHLNEGVGQTAVDSTGNGHDLSLGPTAGVETDDPSWSSSGRFGNCLVFDRLESDYAVGGGSNTFPTNEVTVELWYRTTLLSGFPFNAGFINCQIAFSGPPPSPIYFAIGDGMNWEFCTISDPTVLAVISDGNWHYLAGTYDGAMMRFYVDGAEEATLPATSVLASPSAYHVGGRPSNTFIDGSIDEVRLSDIARSATEISDYFNP